MAAVGAGVIGLFPVATAQTAAASSIADPTPSAAPTPGAPLGGPGRQTLGGPGAIRVEDGVPLAPAPTPTPAPTAKTSFREIADAIDRSADPR